MISRFHWQCCCLLASRHVTLVSTYNARVIHRGNGRGLSLQNSLSSLHHTSITLSKPPQLNSTQPVPSKLTTANNALRQNVRRHVYSLPPKSIRYSERHSPPTCQATSLKSPQTRCEPSYLKQCILLIASTELCATSKTLLFSGSRASYATKYMLTSSSLWQLKSSNLPS
jgi:hypothetical protein